MRVHAIKHVLYEGPGSIADWARERGYQLTESTPSVSEFPSLNDVDMLVVLGGPMSADDHGRSPWLIAEKDYVRQAIDQNVLVLGICLGAQILADVIGGTIKRNEYAEIGWYPLRRTADADRDPLFAAFPDVFVAGHWHGDTFDLPSGVQPVLSSDATANQAFSYNEGRVVGLQFHLEWTRPDLEALVEHSLDELEDGGPYLTTSPQILSGIDQHGEGSRRLMSMLLDLMVSLAESRG